MDRSSLPMFAFGWSEELHTARALRHILRCYDKKGTWKANKQELMDMIVRLEQEISGAEDVVIRKWLRTKSSNGTTEKLRGDLDIARDPSSSLDEPFSAIVQQRVAKRASKQLAPKLPKKIRYHSLDLSDKDLHVAKKIKRELQALPPSFRDCCVCMDSLSHSNFPQQKITATCNHSPTVCLGCLTQSINSQIPDVAWDQVKCPECSEPLPFDVVKTWASEEFFERYDRNSVMAAFGNLPNFKMCLGPSCELGQIHEGGDDQPIMTCTICRFKTCFTHKMPWHSEQTCNQYDEERKERMEQEAASAKLIAETAKICPNPACGHGITKIEGCDHMTCRQCRYQFCYKCLASWEVILREGNTAHAPTCHYHTNNLVYDDDQPFHEE